MNKIIILMDSFKGTLTSIQACKAVAEGIKASGYSGEITKIPISDGGEGFVDAYLHNFGGQRVKVKVTGPDYSPVEAQYALVDEGRKAVIEMALASGLNLTKKRNPLYATSKGTGELIRNAIDIGVKKIILGLGGSATNDGGIGMLSALGVVFLNEKRKAVPVNGLGLSKIASIDCSKIHPGIRGCSFMVCCDVKNKLLGDNGAAAIYAPQKGALKKDIAVLEEGMLNFKEVIYKYKGKDIGNFEGSGAAGGLGAGLSAFAKTNICFGIDYLLEKIKFNEIVQGASIVFTGEGKIDKQTPAGKVPVGVAKAVRKICKDNVPVVAIVGEMDDGYQAVYDEGITAVFSTLHRIANFELIKKDAYDNLKDTASNIMRLVN